MRESTIRLLLGYAGYTDRLSYFDDWFDAFQQHPGFEILPFNVAEANQEAKLRSLLGNCDAVVLLHSTNGDTTAYLEPYVAALADRRVPLLSFVGNEVNLPGSPIAEKRRLFAIMRPDWIATQLLHEAGQYLFGDVAGRGVISVPHALNPSVFKAMVPGETRPTDIGTRLSRYLPHLGDDDRNRIADYFRDNGPGRGLSVDIANSRLDRDGWVAFLNRCKGTISTEAGSWYLERDDATVNAIRTHVLAAQKGVVIANDSPLRLLGHKLPWAIKAALRRLLGIGFVRHEALVNEQLSHADIHARFFAARPRPDFYGKCISSRHFDAVGTKTCQIMFRGRFNDILEADRHYLALNPDFSNMEEVLARFRDPGERRGVAEAAHAHVAGAHTYRHRLDQLYAILSESQDNVSARTKAAG